MFYLTPQTPQDYAALVVVELLVDFFLGEQLRFCVKGEVIEVMAERADMLVNGGFGRLWR